jgi:hypothetical protein
MSSYGAKIGSGGNVGVAFLLGGLAGGLSGKRK